MDWTEDSIEQFIRENKDRFDRYLPLDRHEDHFLRKLSNRFKILISIVPYLIRVAIVTIIVFVVSICVWNQYIRKDRHEVTLKQKIENIFKYDNNS